MHTSSRLIGFTADRFTPAPVSMHQCAVALICRSPDSFYGFRFILPSRSSSSEFLRSQSSPGIFRCPASPAFRFRSLFATSLERVDIFAGRPTAPLRSVLRLSQPLDGFFRSRACRLISSRNHVQGPSRPGVFSPHAATLPRQKELPPCRCLTARSRSRSGLRRFTPASTCDASRLRGLDPRRAAFLESGYSPRPKPLPSSSSGPPGSLFFRRQLRLLGAFRS